tara:strand:+ start:824 stop:1045 length:222 start_codon:yes stop_codon:yes gene_type:complete
LALSEVVQKVLVETVTFFRVGEDLLKTTEVLLFTFEKELLNTKGKILHLLWRFEEPIRMTNSGGFQRNVTMGL